MSLYNVSYAQKRGKNARYWKREKKKQRERERERERKDAYVTLSLTTAGEEASSSRGQRVSSYLQSTHGIPPIRLAQVRHGRKMEQGRDFARIQTLARLVHSLRTTRVDPRKQTQRPDSLRTYLDNSCSPPNSHGVQELFGAPELVVVHPEYASFPSNYANGGRHHYHRSLLLAS